MPSRPLIVPHEEDSREIMEGYYDEMAVYATVASELSNEPSALRQDSQANYSRSLFI